MDIHMYPFKSIISKHMHESRRIPAYLPAYSSRLIQSYNERIRICNIQKPTYY